MIGSRPAYRPWLKRFFVIVSILLSIVASFNLLVDGVGVFRFNSGLKYMAENLIKGKMVAGALGRNDERELQRLIVEQYTGRRDVIAIGSSRLMMLRGRFIKGNPDFFNHSVAGSGMEDLLGIIGLYKEKGRLPRKVVLGIDPWIFNKTNIFGDAWKTLEHYYRIILSEIDNGAAGAAEGDQASSKPRISLEQFLAHYEQLINLDYTIQNWGYLRKGKRLRVCSTYDIDDFVRESDGSLHFPYGMRYASAGNQASQTATPNRVSAATLSEYSLQSIDKLESLVRFLRANSVAVVIVLPPFSPTTYRSCLRDAQHCSMLATEEKIRELAQRNGITVLGSYDPAKDGFEEKDFFDPTHGHETVMKRLFSEYVQ